MKKPIHQDIKKKESKMTRRQDGITASQEAKKLATQQGTSRNANMSTGHKANKTPRHHHIKKYCLQEI